MNIAKRELQVVLFLIGILFLLAGCYKNVNQKTADEKTKITASVIEYTRENCRLSNESDCRPIEIRKGEAENEEINNTGEAAIVGEISNSTINLSEETPLLYCQEGWKCVEKNYKAYQYANCSWISIEYCVYGCKNGACKPPPICKPSSLKCDKDNLAVCNEDGSEWKLNQSCDYQCSDGACVGKNETVQINTTTQNNFLSDNCISVLNFNYAPAGNNLSQEYFTLKNSCSYQIDLSGWTAKDNSTHIYTFPSFNLANAVQVTVVTGPGSNNASTLYWGRGSAVWNNNGDTLYLNASNGASVLIYSYP